MELTELANVKVTISVPQEIDDYVRENASPRKMGDFYAACVRLAMNPQPGEGAIEQLTEEIRKLRMLKMGE